MSQTARQARLLKSAMDEPIFPVPLPVDVTDPEAFPEFELSRQHLASLSPERRAELNEGWNND